MKLKVVKQYPTIEHKQGFEKNGFKGYSSTFWGKFYALRDHTPKGTTYMCAMMCATNSFHPQIVEIETLYISLIMLHKAKRTDICILVDS